ncbi:uncharacterized protein [Argopecten irradians]|uniref:uncharacterized protein n=1 Tax=Argopecten irradians TaxID=31199 RepID=UPI003723BED6
MEAPDQKSTEMTKGQDNTETINETTTSTVNETSKTQVGSEVTNAGSGTLGSPGGPGEWTTEGGRIKTPTTPGIHNQLHNNRRLNKQSKDKEKEEKKRQASRRKHIIIISLMIVTFVGSAAGLVVLYTHLNELDAIEVIESHNSYSDFTREQTPMDRCQAATRKAVQNCFDADDYFSESQQDKQCSYLENVGECAMEKRILDNGQNCSGLLDLLQNVKFKDTFFGMAKTYLSVDIRECSFYNGTAVEEIMKTQGGSFGDRFNAPT